MFEFLSESLDDTKKIAESLATLLQAGDVLDLKGEMGAGKTTFVKALAKALGVEDTVSSPSFGLVHIYDGEMTLYHMDFYRLKREEELLDLDFERYFYPKDGISLIEWGSRVENFLPEDRIQIRIEIVDDHRRRFCLQEEFRGVALGEELRQCGF